MTFGKGHHLHLIDRADVTDPDVVIDFIRGHRIDYVDAVPALQAEYVRAGLVNPSFGQHIPRWLSTGGEAFSPSLWTELHQNPAVTVFNLYGPTETTVEITFATVAATPRPSLGGPSLGADLHILDRRRRAVHRRTTVGARLPPASGPDRAAVRGQPVRHR